MSEPAHNFKFPQIYNYLLTIKHAEISEEGGYHEISCILREKFSSWKEMEEHQWENVEVSGGGKIIKFNAEMKEMIFHTCSEKDKSIYKEWQKIPRSSHNRTEREKYVVDEHKKIADKIHKKYIRICVKAFGPICGNAKINPSQVFLQTVNVRLESVRNVWRLSSKAYQDTEVHLRFVSTINVRRE